MAFGVSMSERERDPMKITGYLPTGKENDINPQEYIGA